MFQRWNHWGHNSSGWPCSFGAAAIFKGLSTCCLISSSRQFWEAGINIYCMGEEVDWELLLKGTHPLSVLTSVPSMTLSLQLLVCAMGT